MTLGRPQNMIERKKRYVHFNEGIWRFEVSVCCFKKKEKVYGVVSISTCVRGLNLILNKAIRLSN